jgi:hypothetical protein
MTSLATARSTLDPLHRSSGCASTGALQKGIPKSNIPSVRVGGIAGRCAQANQCSLTQVVDGQCIVPLRLGRPNGTEDV